MPNKQKLNEKNTMGWEFFKKKHPKKDSNFEIELQKIQEIC
jgi:hypothetical protein